MICLYYRKKSDDTDFTFFGLFEFKNKMKFDIFLKSEQQYCRFISEPIKKSYNNIFEVLEISKFKIQIGLNLKRKSFNERFLCAT